MVHVSLCLGAVQEDLLNGKEDGEFIKELAARITTPTLVLWGDHDRVSITRDPYTTWKEPHHQNVLASLTLNYLIGLVFL